MFSFGLAATSFFCSAVRLSAGVSKAAAELVALVVGELRQLLLEGRARRTCCCLALTSACIFAGLGLDRPRPWRGRRRCRATRSRCAGPPPVRRVERRLEDGPQAVVVGLRDRVVAVVVALGAADRQAQQRRADDLERVGDDLVGRQRPARRRSTVPSGAMRRKPVAVSSSICSGVEVRPRRRHQLVAGELLDDEPVERLVGVEGADDVVAILVRRTAAACRRCRRRRSRRSRPRRASAGPSARRSAARPAAGRSACS